MKKVFFFLSIIICAFTSCTKDYSYENPNAQPPDLTRNPTVDPGQLQYPTTDTTGNAAGGNNGSGGAPQDTTQNTTTSNSNPTNTQGGGNNNNTNVSPYYMRFKVDGVTTEYKKVVLAFKLNYQNEYSISIQGQNVIASNPPSLSLIVSDKTPISTKTYFELTNSSISTMQYRNEGGIDFSSGFTNTASQFKTEITEITATGIKGTFSGHVSDFTSQKLLNITEGEFFAKF